LGDYSYGSEEYIFNLVDYGYTGTTFSVGLKGTAKRVLNPNNVTDTISEYYVRKHKIVTNVNDALLVKTGFEENSYNNVKKYESSGFTPDGQARVSVKEGGQAYWFFIRQSTKTINRIIFYGNLEGIFWMDFGHA
jgi:hypothetical protein